MSTTLRRFIFPIGIAVCTSFSVFALPFLFPPPYLAGVSAANVAGFNNQVASVAAAAMGTIVFFISFFWIAPSMQTAEKDYRPIPRRMTISALCFLGSATAAYSCLILFLHMRYLFDAGYFIEQISMYTDYSKKLYDEIEFPYGPLLFYSPVAVRAVLSPIHATLREAYFVTLVLEQIAGLWLLIYALDNLPIVRNLRILVLVFFVCLVLPFNLGLNYTYFRFMPPFAILLAIHKVKRPVAAAAWIFLGQVFCLGISPEIAFAFFAGSVAYAGCRCFRNGWLWLAGVAAPFFSIAAFFWVMGGAYLRMMNMFAHGVFNLIVEPLPHILIYLFALVWLIPRSLAWMFRESREDAPVLAAMYVAAVAVLPVAFGRCDPGHVFYNGLGIYLLSMVAVSLLPMRQRLAWAVCVAALMVWMMVGFRGVLWNNTIRPVLREAVLQYGSEGMKETMVRRSLHLSPEETRAYLHDPDASFEEFHLDRLQAIAGRDPVATPYPIPLAIEEALKRSGQYTPAFYAFTMGVLDAKGEDREIADFNQWKWALVPKGPPMSITEAPEDSGYALGFQLPYHSKRTPYVIGRRLAKNLADNWQLCGEDGAFLVYRRRTGPS
jgi:hypothetical protein